MTELPFELPAFQPGSVWLAGAGPGDPGLLSLLAAHALRQADVVVYDALVDERVLDLARPGTPREFAGKRGGRPSPKQFEISARLVVLARQGLRVLRLKGGDPFVFGRGAEEALALVAAGVPFRVVPGITAGVGGLAYAGIPATARDANSAIAFVTGHDADGALPGDIDWGALARGAPALVFYMAMKQLDVLTGRLVAAGRSPDEAVVVISRATTPRERVLESTLGEVAAAVRAAGMEPPALLVVGNGIVGLRKRLDWRRDERAAQ